jgi:hypothetical protein
MVVQRPVALPLHDTGTTGGSSDRAATGGASGATGKGARTRQPASEEGRSRGGTASKTVPPGMTRESTHVRLGGEKDSRTERSANPRERGSQRPGTSA